MGSASLRVTKGAGSTGGVRRGSLTLKAGSPVPSQVAQVGRNGTPGSSARSVSSELREPRLLRLVVALQVCSYSWAFRFCRVRCYDTQNVCTKWMNVYMHPGSNEKTVIMHSNGFAKENWIYNFENNWKKYYTINLSHESWHIYSITIVLSMETGKNYITCNSAIRQNYNHITNIYLIKE